MKNHQNQIQMNTPIVARILEAAEVIGQEPLVLTERLLSICDEVLREQPVEAARPKHSSPV